MEGCHVHDQISIPTHTSLRWQAAMFLCTLPRSVFSEDDVLALSASWYAVSASCANSSGRLRRTRAKVPGGGGC